MRGFPFLVAFLCLGVTTPHALAEPSPVSAALRKTVTLEFDNLSFAECADRLRSVTKLNVVIHESLQPLLAARDMKLKEAADSGPASDSEAAKQVALPQGFSCRLRQMPLAAALQIFLDHYGLGYTAVEDTLILASAEKARQLEREQIVSVAFAEVPLTKALQELKDRFAIRILVDARAVKDVSITLDAPNVSLEEAMDLLADQAGLKAAALENGWLLTTAEKAKEWQARTKQRQAEKKAATVMASPDAPGAAPLGGFIGAAPTGGFGGLGFLGGSAGFNVEVPRALLQVAGPSPRGAQPPAKTQPGPQPPNVPADKKSAAVETRKKMSEPFDFPGAPPMTLAEAFKVLEDRGCPPIVIHLQAFKDESPDAPDLYEAAIRFPPMKGLTRGKVLRLLLEQASPSANYLVRPGYILVTTNDASRPNGQFVQGANFVQRPLDEALEELSDLSGVSIVLDPRVGDKAKTPITARFPSQTNVAQAARLLADMADLKAVMVDTTMYITSRGNATVFPEEAPSGGKYTRKDAGL